MYDLVADPTYVVDGSEKSAVAAGVNPAVVNSVSFVSSFSPTVYLYLRMDACMKDCVFVPQIFLLAL